MANPGGRSAVEQHQKEIQRRSSVAREGAASGAAFARVEGVGDDAPFYNQYQQWVLFSTSHTGMAPVSESPDRPALRIYGCFPDRESALDFADVIRSADASCNVQLNRTHTWVLACKNEERLQNAEYVAAKTERLVAQHLARIEAGHSAFKENVKRMQEDNTPIVGTDAGIPSDDEEEIASPPSAPGAPRSGRRAPSMLPRYCELSGQSAACVCFVQDDPGCEEPEFLFNVLSCFGTDTEADRYVRNVAAQQVSDYDIDVISTISWVFPTVPIENMKKEYRSTELTRIMECHRSQAGNVAEFRRQLEAEELPPPILEGESSEA